jgi:hypothetical protein
MKSSNPAPAKEGLIDPPFFASVPEASNGKPMNGPREAKKGGQGG